MRLLDVPQLERLAELEERFGVRFRLHGGLPHRLFLAELREQPLDLFETGSLLGDVDLVHDGGPSLTPAVMTTLMETLPAAECFRWQLRSYGEEDIFERARSFNNVVPALRLAVHRDGFDDPEDGRSDIERGRYRFHRNPRYRRSPLYLAGRDVEAASALLYLRVLASSGLDGDALEGQPGLAAARAVLASDAAAPTMARLQQNAWLRARLRYLVNSVTAAAPSERALAYLEDRVGWQEFARHVAAAGVPLPPFRLPDPGTAAVIPARLGPDLYRLRDEREPWLVAEGAREALDRRLHDADGDASPSAEPLRLAPGQDVLLASPPFALASGISGSSYLTPQLCQELAHFDLRLATGWMDAEGCLGTGSRRYDASSLGLLVVTRDMRHGRTGLFGMPAAVTVRRETAPPHCVRVGVRANSWAALEDVGRAALPLWQRALWRLGSRPPRPPGVPPATVQFFIVGWHGEA